LLPATVCTSLPARIRICEVCWSKWVMGGCHECSGLEPRRHRLWPDIRHRRQRHHGGSNGSINYGRISGHHRGPRKRLDHFEGRRWRPSPAVGVVRSRHVHDRRAVGRGAELVEVANEVLRYAARSPAGRARWRGPIDSWIVSHRLVGSITSPSRRPRPSVLRSSRQSSGMAASSWPSPTRRARYSQPRPTGGARVRMVSKPPPPRRGRGLRLGWRRTGAGGHRADRSAK